jgi:hypothetical protein
MTTSLVGQLATAGFETALPAAPLAPVETAKTLEAGMCAVDLLIRRPSGRVQIKATTVQATNDTGETETIEDKKVTKPQAIVDRKEDHPLWAEIDENARRCDAVLRRFSVNDAKRGFHLLPMSKVPDFLKELVALRTERLELARRLRDDYDTWIENLRKKFNGHFHLIQPKLPSQESLMEKFDVAWVPMPLTPINADQFDFKHLSADDRMRIINQSNNMANELIKKRAKFIYDEVFGTVLKRMEEIAKGGLSTGKRKNGAIKEITEELERLINFRELADDPKIIAHAEELLKQFKSVTDISQINANEGQNAITAALATAGKQLGDVIRPFLASNPAAPGKGKSSRSVLI